MTIVTEMLAAVEAAIKRGVLEVRHADGRMVRYPSLEALLRARQTLVDQAAAEAAGGATSVRRTTLAAFERW